MASRVKIPKSLVESSEFDKHKTQIMKDAKRLDDILWGVTFTLACNPELYPAVDGTEIRIAKTDPAPGAPPLTVYFKEFEDKIVLLDIEITPEDNNHG